MLKDLGNQAVLNVDCDDMALLHAPGLVGQALPLGSQADIRRGDAVVRRSDPVLQEWPWPWRFAQAPEGTPMANVMLSLLHRLGLDDLNSFGDSTGEFSFSAPAVG